jgi:hypothetical protein
MRIQRIALRQPADRVPLQECLTKKKPRCATHSFGIFVFILLQKQAFDEFENKKAGYFVPGFFFVAEGGFEPPTFGL